ncbi:MAG: four helix bundle protein [Opitutaceae bacterium]|jgi:four helix bundle protein
MADVFGVSGMTPEELSERLLVLALRVGKMADALPTGIAARNAAGQVIRSSSSAAANYRAAQRGRSHKDFSNKVGVALEEADETAFWLEYIERYGLLSAKRLSALRKEADELVRILATIRKNARD